MEFDSVVWSVALLCGTMVFGFFVDLIIWIVHPEFRQERSLGRYFVYNWSGSLRVYRFILLSRKIIRETDGFILISIYVFRVIFILSLVLVMIAVIFTFMKY